MAFSQIVIRIGNFSVFYKEFHTQPRIDAVTVAYMPDAAGEGAFFEVLSGRTVVGNVGCPVFAPVVAGLADTGGKRSFVFIHIPDD